MKQSIRVIITTLRGLKHRSTRVAPFEAHFGRCRNTALRNLVTKASQKNLGYHKILSALDALTITDKKPLISADADEQVPSDEEVYPRVRTVVNQNTAIAKAPLFLVDEAMLRGPPNVQRVQGM